MAAGWKPACKVRRLTRPPPEARRVHDARSGQPRRALDAVNTALANLRLQRVFTRAAEPLARDKRRTHDPLRSPSLARRRLCADNPILRPRFDSRHETVFRRFRVSL